MDAESLSKVKAKVKESEAADGALVSIVAAGRSAARDCSASALRSAWLSICESLARTGVKSGSIFSAVTQCASVRSSRLVFWCTTASLSLAPGMSSATLCAAMYSASAAFKVGRSVASICAAGSDDRPRAATKRTMAGLCRSAASRASASLAPGCGRCAPRQRLRRSSAPGSAWGRTRWPLGRCGPWRGLVGMATDAGMRRARLQRQARPRQKAGWSRFGWPAPQRARCRALPLAGRSRFLLPQTLARESVGQRPGGVGDVATPTPAISVLARTPASSRPSC